MATIRFYIFGGLSCRPPCIVILVVSRERERQRRWGEYCKVGLALKQELQTVLVDWVLPPQLNACLNAWTCQLVGGVHYLQLMILMVDEEIQDWRNEGQWNATSSNTVARELHEVDVPSFDLFLFCSC